MIYRARWPKDCAGALVYREPAFGGLLGSESFGAPVESGVHALCRALQRGGSKSPQRGQPRDGFAERAEDGGAQERFDALYILERGGGPNTHARR